MYFSSSHIYTDVLLSFLCQILLSFSLYTPFMILTMKCTIVSDHCYKMVRSDRSESDEGDLDGLRLSSDSTDITPKKRLRAEGSEDETDLPAKKRQNTFNERSKVLDDNAEAVSDKDNTDGCDMKEKKYTQRPENEQKETSPTESDVDGETKEKQSCELKQESNDETTLDGNNVALNKNPEETNIKTENVEDTVI